MGRTVAQRVEFLPHSSSSQSQGSFMITSMGCMEFEHSPCDWMGSHPQPPTPVLPHHKNMQVGRLFELMGMWEEYNW